ncbi:twin-arginine translocase TatA/TatE family subunit [Paenibacillus piri]|uniref:Sec-independent protein translocase protein TatA n=1 Tax=Paenibacillus piri TaxID=2547395 RepID=A0A4V2ZT82_9BACL|nr:twin-arginine translocase TatA/TatE family subunit [Paenibacillus piri]
MSLSHLLLIAIVALVLFGPNKLPELGRAIGRTMREFKKGAEGLLDDVQTAAPQEERKDVTPRPQPDPVSAMVLPPVPASPSDEQRLQEPPADGQRVTESPAEAAQEAAAPVPPPKPADTRRLPD